MTPKQTKKLFADIGKLAQQVAGFSTQQDIIRNRVKRLESTELDPMLKHKVNAIIVALFSFFAVIIYSAYVR